MPINTVALLYRCICQGTIPGIWYSNGSIIIDGEPKKALRGTGTEDFFNTSWCPASIFTHPYYGYARVNRDNGWLGRTHAYRFFIADPIYFNTSLKGSIEHGHNNNLTLDRSQQCRLLVSVRGS